MALFVKQIVAVSRFVVLSQQTAILLPTSLPRSATHGHPMLHRGVFLLKISELPLGSCYVPARFAPGMVLTARRC